MKTKVFATLGPAFNTKEMLLEAAFLGVGGFRINLSHGNLADFKEWLDNIKSLGNKHEVIIDLQGPELRLGDLQKPLLLLKNNVYPLALLPIPDFILEKIKCDSVVAIDDGKIIIRMLADDSFMVLEGGEVKGRKSIKINGQERFLPIVSKRDLKNLEECRKYGVTSLMCPFIESRKDLQELKDILKSLGLNLRIYSKIEDLKGITNLEQIADASDVVVIARGDLGNATGLSSLPYFQRKIADYCKREHIPYMVVTEMLNSMINNPLPTRAEVNDIFEAVAYGAEYLMLTGETAIGKYPINAIRMMIDVAKEAEKYLNECQ